MYGKKARRSSLHALDVYSTAMVCASGHRRSEAIDFYRAPGFLVMGFAKDGIDTKENPQKGASHVPSI